MRHFLNLIFAFLMLTLGCSVVRAESVVITSGSHTTGGFSGGGFAIAGDGVNLTGGVNYARMSCAPCRAGEMLHFASDNTGMDIRSGSGTVNGVSYDKLYYDGALRFAGSIVIPTTESALVTLVAPFTFTGTLSGCGSSTISGCAGGYLFSTELAGRGLATILLSSYDSGAGFRLYDVRSVAYSFDEKPTPNPEPATLLLLGTGVTGAAAVARRRRRQTDVSPEPQA